MIFSKSDKDIGRIPESYGYHEIHLTDYSPIKQQPYNTPQVNKEANVEDALKKMLNMTVIKESDSNWASPIVLVMSNVSLLPTLPCFWDTKSHLPV